MERFQMFNLTNLGFVLVFFLPYAVMQDAGGKKEGIWKQTWTACCGLNRHIKLSICRPLTRLLIRLLT